jgi:NADH dehydrogenase [ubiquinone] 1 alpha subcomplex assembly factor 7
MRRVKMTELSKIIHEIIKENGPISIGTYMSLCLGHPQFGYYMQREAFGAQGDFITAPEVSQLFGEMISIWVMLTYERMGSPESLQLVELGPGRGTLMSDIWRGLGTQPGLREKTQIHLVEFSPRLHQIQADTLEGLPVTWHTNIETVPQAPTIFIANEFFDALPIEQAIYHQDDWHQRQVTSDEIDIFFTTGDILQGLPNEEMPEGSIFEYAPLATTIMQQLCRFIDHNGGALLAIDYGDDAPLNERIGDTLQALQKHQMVDIFDEPGHADLTAHVAFSSLEMIAQEENCETLPVTTQREFLTQLGIRLRLDKLLPKATPEQAEQLQSGLERLIDPLQMGDLFKVLQVFGK